MTRAGVGALVAVALTAGLALRLVRLDARPMHHDEANQAVKFGALLERGEYRFDAHDHHGPTLYYLSLPAAWLRGQHTLASLDERTLRGVTVAFGAGTILLLPLLSGGIGKTAVAASATLMALSPAMVFYSRMFIQESLFACFTLALVIAVGRLAMSGGLRWATLAGLAGGLAIATKETSMIVVPAALVACLVSWRSLDPAARPAPVAFARPAAVGLAVAVTVAALFYSSFLTFPAGLIQPFLSIGTYLDRGVDPANHAHPWYYYLGLLTYHSAGGLTWSEAVVLMLAVVGIVTASASPDRSRPARAFWTRYLACYVVITTAIFSAIPYKTPWNLLPFYAGVIVLAGVGFSRLVYVTSSRGLRGAVIASFIVGSGYLGWQAWRASVTYAADPRNPYVYAQTVPDTMRLARRIRDLAATHPDGERMQVSVVAAPYEQWPLPWYLRAMPDVGYWAAPGDPVALQAPVVVASMEHSAAIEAALGDRYLSEFYGLRPDVLLGLYIERGLWERFLARVALGECQNGCAGASGPSSRHRVRAATGEVWRTASAR
jgi:uncharacterized protein (TIGR03663 family)